MFTYPPLFSARTPFLLEKAQLIVVEGVDGIGKTTLLEQIAQGLRSRKHVKIYKEPYERHRQFKRNFSQFQDAATSDPQESSYQKAVLGRALRMVEDLREMDEEGVVILVDRFVHTTAAYQATTPARFAVLKEGLEKHHAGRANYTLCINPTPMNLNRMYHILEDRFSHRENDEILPQPIYNRMVRSFSSMAQGDDRYLKIDPFNAQGRIKSRRGVLLQCANWMSSNP